MIIEMLRANPLVIQLLPIGAEDHLEGVVDLAAMKEHNMEFTTHPANQAFTNKFLYRVREMIIEMLGAKSTLVIQLPIGAEHHGSSGSVTSVT
jgi:hypothetical protein